MPQFFISYGAADRPLADTLADDLDLLVHDAEVWLDPAADRQGDALWWTAITDHIAACDALLAALSPALAASEVCRREIAYALDLGKPIVPVIVDALGSVELPDVFQQAGPLDYRARDRAQQRALRDRLYALDPAPDLADPLPAPPPAPDFAPPPPPPAPPPKTIPFNPPKLNLDPPAASKAVPFSPPKLDFSAKKVGAPTAAPPKRAFRYADRLKAAPPRVDTLLPGPFEWIDVPAGVVTVHYQIEEGTEAFNPLDEGERCDVAAFTIARYPVTNAQYAKFIEAGGYDDPRWWTNAGWMARSAGWAWDGDSLEKGWAESPRPWSLPRYVLNLDLDAGDQPVVGVSWHEAIAFCRWLSETTGERVTLPTEQQWQRAAQGDDARAWTWGDEWDAALCNNDVSGRTMGRVTSVMQFEAALAGRTPFGLVDQTGNVWEWCLTSYDSGSISAESDDSKVLRGGSWYDTQPDVFRCAVRNWDDAALAQANVGFRIVRGYAGKTLIRHLTRDGLIDPDIEADSLTDAARYEPSDGVYTIANTFDSFKTLRLDAHLDRLEDSARRAGVALWLDRPALRAALRAMIMQAAYGDVRYRIAASNQMPGTLMLAIEPFRRLAGSVYEQGVRVVTAPGSARHDPAAKTTDWVLNRQAIEAALPEGVFTALLLGEGEAILEGISSNFYAVIDGVLYTAGEGVLAGIAQQIVFAVAPGIVPVVRTPITLADLSRCTDAFITSASRGIVPVVAIDGVIIADGTPGAITRALRDRYLDWVEAHLEPL